MGRDSSEEYSSHRSLVTVPHQYVQDMSGLITRGYSTYKTSQEKIYKRRNVCVYLLVKSFANLEMNSCRLEASESFTIAMMEKGRNPNTICNGVGCRKVNEVFQSTTAHVHWACSWSTSHGA